MESARLDRLQHLISFARAGLEARGIRVDGYGGDTKEGLVWHYDFAEQWPLPPDRASVRVSLWWGPIYGPEQVEIVRVYRCAEIFRQGHPSFFKRVSERAMSIESLESTSLGSFVHSELDEGGKEIQGAN
jgi:hypothetical protein